MAAGRAKYIWGDYGSNQRRYDPFHNEWDLCSDFDPDDEPDEYDDDDDEDYDDYPPVPQNFETASLSTEHRTVQASSIATMNAICPSSESSEDIIMTHHTEHIMSIAYFRFGLHPAPEARGSEGQDWETCRRICGFSQSESSDLLIGVPNMTRLLMGSFFDLLANHTPLTEIPPDLLDLRQLTAPIHTIPPKFNSSFVNNANGTFCIIRPLPESTETPLELGLCNAVDYLEIRRRGWGPRLVDVATELVLRGIPFHVCRTAPRPTIYISPPVPYYSGLGYRPQDYEPDYHDYRLYLSHREDFLRSPRGQLALRAGGIVTRIARDTIVLNPSLVEAPVDLNSSAFISDGSVGHFYDELSSHEVDLICGVYHVDTGLTLRR
jgi:hypothetical protein